MTLPTLSDVHQHKEWIYKESLLKAVTEWVTMYDWAKGNKEAVLARKTTTAWIKYFFEIKGGKK